MAFAGATASLVQRESLGSLTLLICSFSAVQSSTYIPGVPNAIGYWATGVSVGVGITTAMAAASASAQSSGVYFNLTCGGGGDAQPVKLYILSRI